MKDEDKKSLQWLAKDLKKRSKGLDKASKKTLEFLRKLEKKIKSKHLQK